MYVVKDKYAWLMLPTGAVVGRRQLWEFRMFSRGQVLVTDGAKPWAVEHLLARGMVEEVNEE